MEDSPARHQEGDWIAHDDEGPYNPACAAGRACRARRPSDRRDEVDWTGDRSPGKRGWRARVHKLPRRAIPGRGGVEDAGARGASSGVHIVPPRPLCRAGRSQPLHATSCDSPRPGGASGGRRLPLEPSDRGPLMALMYPTALTRRAGLMLHLARGCEDFPCRKRSAFDMPPSGKRSSSHFRMSHIEKRRLIDDSRRAIRREIDPPAAPSLKAVMERARANRGSPAASPEGRKS